MTPNRKCEECGAELPANAPQGLCPRCLARMGLEVVGAETPPQRDLNLERTGSMIGRYKLLEKIGEGGFGVVFMAEQVEPVHRKVALKIIKAGMDTKEVIARFEAERQAIALMDHPNIARALDAGATEAGRPYFVMELVRGIPITDYCDQKHLPTRERLKLFIKVCQAVQHAHQKGVIHRDLKPGNVLVTEHDGEPVPKVIDFGVAKALGQKLTEKTLFTGFQHMIGTPAYMSPEQAALSGIDVDTRADTYSLGVLLYELLTGVTPFDAETFRKAGLDEIRRMIRETEPPKPSTRLQTLGQRLTEVAKQRHVEPATLCKLVRGDLDWIVMKCLEKDRKRRYDTANGLAADLTRYLEGDPVIARPPNSIYRFRKLVARNKVAFGAVSAVLAALVMGLSLSTCFLLREMKAKKEQEQLRIVADIERQHAHTEVENNKQVNHYLKLFLGDIAPSLAKGCTKKFVLQVLDRTEDRIGSELKGQPNAEAVVRSGLAEIQIEMGYLADAEVNLRKVVALRESMPKDLDCAMTLVALANVLGQEQNWAESIAFMQQAVVMLEQLAQQDPKNQIYRLHLGRAERLLGMRLKESGNRIEGAKEIESALRRFEQAAGETPDNVSYQEELAVTHAVLGQAQQALGHIDKAEAEYRVAIRLYSDLNKQCKTNGAYYLAEVGVTRSLGTLFADVGRIEEAEIQFTKASSLCELAMPSFPDLADLKRERDLANADLARLFTSRRKPLQDESFEFARSLLRIGERMLWGEGTRPEGEKLILEGYEISQKHGYTFHDMDTYALAHVLQSRGNLTEAEQFFRQAVVHRQKYRYADIHPYALHPFHDLAGILKGQGRFDEVRELYRDELELRRKVYGTNDTKFSNWLLEFANLDIAQGDYAEGISLLEEKLNIERSKRGTNAEQALLTLRRLVDVAGCSADWDQCMELSGELIKSHTNDWQLLRGRAVAALLAGNKQAYLDACSQMSSMSWETSSPALDERTAMVPFLTTDPLPEGDQGFRLARIATNTAPAGPWTSLAQGMAEYRAGNAAEGVRLLESVAADRTLAASPLNRQAAILAGYFSSMARQQLNESTRARALIAKANAQLDDFLRQGNLGEPGEQWWSDAAASILVRGEAERIVLGHEVSPRPTTASLGNARKLWVQHGAEPTQSQSSSPEALLNRPFPGTFTLPFLDDGEITLPDAKGTNVLLLDFCATWCPPCRQAMPVLEKISDDYAAQGVSFVEVNAWGEDPERIRRYLTKAGLHTKMALDRGDRMVKAFQLKAIPTIVIVDRSKIIRYVRVGYSQGAGDEIRKALDQVLNPASPTGTVGPVITAEIRPDEPANLIANGSFELPAYAGDGNVVPSATGIGLPGWTFSPGAGVEHLILEYGQPFGRARYAAGRQAVLLNGDGCQPPLMLAQSFTTVSGQDYVLRFAQGDEEMAGPSNSELAVSVADVRRVFSRKNDTGMVIKSLYFKATSNLTTLTFEDTTPAVPDVFHSPVLDDVSVTLREAEQKRR